MSNEEPSPKIVVRDRRAFTQEGERRSDAPPSDDRRAASSPPPVVGQRPARPEGRKPKNKKKKNRVDQASAPQDDQRAQQLVGLLYQQAVLVLQQTPAGGEGGKAAQDALAVLQELIDMLEVFQEKTRGRLGPGDGRLLDRALYQLRMEFMARRQPPAPAP